jgi:hypothetical protein
MRPLLRSKRPPLQTQELFGIERSDRPLPAREKEPAMNFSSLQGEFREGHERTSSILTHPRPQENATPQSQVRSGVEKRECEISTLIFLSVVMMGVVATWLLPMRWLATIVADDCFYYFKIAQNLAATGIPTFDGINPTNGFHPGWMVVLVVLLRVMPLDLAQDTMARVCLFAQWPFLAASVTILLRSASFRPSLMSSAFSVLCILGVPFLRPISMGLETALAFFFMALFWSTLARYVSDPSHAPWQAGLWGALWEFSRLDAFLIIGSASVFAAAYAKADLQGRSPISYRSLVKTICLVGGPAFAVFLAVAAFNKMYFGHYLTVSAYIKSGFGMPSIGFLSQQFYYPVAALVILAFGIWLMRRERDTEHAARTLCIMSAAIIVYCAVFPWLVKYPLNASWYYYPIGGLVLVAARLVWHVVGTFATYVRPARAVLVIAAAAFAVSSWAYFASKPIFFTRCYDLAIKARELPPGSVIAFTDAGSVGFFSGHPTVNTDGVANSFAFLEAVSSGTVADFLKRSGVTHLVERMPDPAVMESEDVFYSVRGTNGRIHDVAQMPIRKSNLVYSDPSSNRWKLSIFKAYYNEHNEQPRGARQDRSVSVTRVPDTHAVTGKHISWGSR